MKNKTYDKKKSPNLTEKEYEYNILILKEMKNNSGDKS